MKLITILLVVLLGINIYAKSDVVLKLDTHGHMNQIKDLIITKNGDIISASLDKTIRVWDSSIGKEKRKILGEISKGSNGKIYAIALSPDEKYLAVAGYFNNPNDVIRIYNYKTGKIHKLLKYHKNTLRDLSFSEDGKYLVSCASNSKIALWDVSKNFKLVHEITHNINQVYRVKIVNKKHKYYIFALSKNKKMLIYDVNKKKKVFIKSFNISGIRKHIYSLEIDIKHNHIAITFGNHNVYIYDFSLKLVKVIKTRTLPLGLKYSQDGKYLISGTGAKPSTVNVYDVNNNYKIKKTFTKHTNITNSVNFLDNNTVVSAGGFNNEIYIWNINTGKVIKKIEGDSITAFKVAIKGDYIGFINKDIRSKNINIINKKINLNNFTIQNTKNSSISRKKSYLLNSKYKNYSLSTRTIKKYQMKNTVLNILKNGKPFASIKKNSTNGFVHRIYGWYKNFIISGGFDGKLMIYDFWGEEVANLIGHTGDILWLDIDGDKLISTSTDKTIKIWDLTKLNKRKLNEKYIKDIQSRSSLTRKEIIKRGTKANLAFMFLHIDINPTLSLFISKDNEYVAWTNEGFFNASKGGAKYIGYHINQGPNKEAEYVTVDALYSTFYRPDLIQKALAGESLKKYAKNINIQKLLQDGLAPEVHILSKTTNTKNQDLDLSVQVCPKGKGGYDNLTLLINDMPVSVINTSRALKLKKKSKRDDCFIYQQSITLAGGVNNIGFRATNKAGNIESKPEYIKVTFDDTNLKKKLRSKLAKISENQNINDLHILAIAVNKYKDKDLTLKYSINDASVMLKTIQNVAKPLFNKVHTYKLFDNEVTKANIKKAFKDIKSTREDVFLLYIAGHGITDEYNGNYYYIPYDFINKDDEKAVQTQGVGQKDLMLGLSSITALKSLVLLDTCNSGSFVEADMQKTTTNRLARATGRATISASSKSQVALEGYKGHGVFTYTLIEALKGKAYNNDKKITINELNSYVENVLPSRTQDKWGYRQEPQSSMYGVDFNIGAK